MQSKYTALESRSKEMVVHQGSAISCATSALSCLTSRLNSLVEQLIASYNISEQELEVSVSSRVGLTKKNRFRFHMISNVENAMHHA